MTIHSVGDQARALLLQGQTARLRNSLQVLTGELTSGFVADRAGRVGGNTSLIHHFETRIALLTQYQQAGFEAAAAASATQDVLAALQGEASNFSATLISVSAADSEDFVPLRAVEARGHLVSVVGRLNAEVAGLHLFAGQASDTPPLIGAEDMLDALQVLTAGLTTADQVQAAVSNWFTAPPGGGGYLDLAYRGTIDQPRQVQIDADRSMTFTTDAATPAIRDLLAALATAALADSPGLMASGRERLELVHRAGAALLSNESALLDEMGRVGLLESLAERFGTEQAHALGVAEIGRARLITADPFQTATALQEVETQMQTLYSLTARLSKLKLVDYLR